MGEPLARPPISEPVVLGRGRERRLPATAVLSPGAVLGRTFTTWIRNLVPFAILSVLVHAPLLVYTAWVYRSQEAFVAGFSTWIWVHGLASMVLWVPLTGALTFGVVQQISGNPAGIGRSVAVGLRRLGPVLSVGVLVAVYVVAAIVAMMLLLILVFAIFGSRELVQILGIVSGVVAVTLVGAITWVAVPVAVVEERGARASIARSRDLLRGNVLRFFGVVLTLSALGFALGKVIETTLPRDTWEQVRVQVLAQLALGVLVTTPLWAVASAVGYHDLRVGKEGIGTRELARVFE